MNNTFNFRRFGLVLSKDFQENWKRYMYQILAMFGIMFVVLTWYSYSRFYGRYSYQVGEVTRYSLDSLNIELLLYVSFMFLIFGILVAASLMEPMRNKTKRIAYLTNPSSNFEKIFSRWLIVTVGYIIVFFVVLWVVDILRVGFLSMRFPDIDNKMIDLSYLFARKGNYDRYLNIFPSFKVFFTVVSFYAFLQSLFILGATFWEKASFVKTFSALIVIALLFFFIYRWVISIFYKDIHQFGNIIESFGSPRIDERTALLFLAGIFLFFTILNWTLAVVRFKESEIIKRL